MAVEPGVREYQGAIKLFVLDVRNGFALVVVRNGMQKQLELIDTHTLPI